MSMEQKDKEQMEQLIASEKYQQILCFAHEYAKPKVIKQADTITEFVEKKLVTYLKNN